MISNLYKNIVPNSSLENVLAGKRYLVAFFTKRLHLNAFIPEELTAPEK